MADLLVGIDIGNRCVKVAAFEQKARLHLVNVFYFPTPYDASQESHKQINTGALLKKITDSIPLKTLRAAKISVNLPDSAITALSVLLPVMSRKELVFAAINEAKQRMIPPSVAEHIFECLFLGERTVNKVNKSEVLVIRTENLQVQRRLDLFKPLDITPALITPACCVVPSILPKDIWTKEENIVLVDAGAASLNISIARQGKLEFVRNISYGFNDIIQDISRQLSVSEEKAAQAIMEQGVPDVPFDMKNKVAIAEEIMRQKYEESLGTGVTAEPVINSLELRWLWQPHLERIIQELRRSLVFYREQSEGRRVEQIYFLGGVSQVKNFVVALSTQIGGVCYLLEPFKDMDIVKEVPSGSELAHSSIYVNSASLALAITALKEKELNLINFLPLELRRKEAVAKRRMLLLISAMALVCIFSLLSFQLFLGNMHLRKKIKANDFQLKRLKHVGTKLKEMQEKEKGIENKSSQIEQKAKENINVGLLLKDLKRVVPEGVVLSNLELTKEKLIIKGFVFLDYEEAVSIIEDFRGALAGLAYYQDVKVEPLELKEISPQFSASGEVVVLTQPERRKFAISAQIVIK